MIESYKFFTVYKDFSAYTDGSEQNVSNEIKHLTKPFFLYLRETDLHGNLRLLPFQLPFEGTVIHDIPTVDPCVFIYRPQQQTPAPKITKPKRRKREFWTINEILDLEKYAGRYSDWNIIIKKFKKRHPNRSVDSVKLKFKRMQNHKF